jgi:hypothetical protein
MIKQRGGPRPAIQATILLSVVRHSALDCEVICGELFKSNEIKRRTHKQHYGF